MQVDNRPDSGPASAQPATGQPEQDQAKPIMRWPVALAVMVVALVILLGGGSLLVRQFTRPSSGPLGTVPASVATQEVTSTRPGTLGTTASATAPSTSAPTPAPTVSATQVTAPSVSTSAPAVGGQAADEIAAAYMRYWDVRAQALYTLDASHLSDVAGGESLTALIEGIDGLKASGRALKSEVQHNYSVVDVNDREAHVRDSYRDLSIYVDAGTKQPLPGEVSPSNPEDAPLNTVVFQLQKDGATWKVVNAERYAND